MSYFRNFNTLVSSQLFAKPNNLVLRSCIFPKTLCESSEPTINHLHTVKALFNTIHTLKNHQSELEEGSYQKEIQSELRYLEKAGQQYRVSVRKYIENNAKLTAEGIANVYASAQDLEVDSKWLGFFLHNQIPSKASNMSRKNLIDVIQGVKQHHPESPYLQMLEGLLKQKNATSGEPQYVKRYGNQLTQFELSENVASNNCLIRAIQQKRAYPLYFAYKNLNMIWARVLSYRSIQMAYPLHNE